MFKNKKHLFAIYFKNFIFGVEDSLVSTIGLISGVAATGSNKASIILTGVILVFVEALSMGVGSLLSEHSAQEFENKKATPFHTSVVAGVIMFISYFLAGFVPLLPYVLLTPNDAFWISIGFSLLSLFILGAVSGKALKVSLLRKGLEMFILGGLAVAVGVGAGILVKNYFL